MILAPPLALMPKTVESQKWDLSTALGGDSIALKCDGGDDGGGDGGDVLQGVSRLVPQL